MIRPRLVLLSFLLVMLGLAAAAEAAESLPFLLAQAATRRPVWPGRGCT